MRISAATFTKSGSNKLDIESPEPSDITEAIKVKEHELRNRVRIQKEEEKKREREREKEQIRAGKELLEAKRIAEENECLLALRKAVKEEEKRAREKVLNKLKVDETSLPVKSIKKDECMRECLISLNYTYKASIEPDVCSRDIIKGKAIATSSAEHPWLESAHLDDGVGDKSSAEPLEGSATF
ncbi:hypothetical protein CCACVL1_19718 [Corchorus capsularis]|uniref:Uncharacterized protein n=1 Tax=Corchorus capsularis TaxID=210143 RepID=A0A1R3HF68_COCAP|nr:hypothetical protein CCACVL1_19718 [Corchorus capsularis]